MTASMELRALFHTNAPYRIHWYKRVHNRTIHLRSSNNFKLVQQNEKKVGTIQMDMKYFEFAFVAMCKSDFINSFLFQQNARCCMCWELCTTILLRNSFASVVFPVDGCSRNRAKRVCGSIAKEKRGAIFSRVRFSFGYVENLLFEDSFFSVSLTLSLSPALSFITALFFYCEVVMLCNVCADSFGGCRLGRTARLLSEMDEKKLTEPGRSNNKQLEYRRWACSQKT